MPVANYAPELIELFRQGFQKPVVIPGLRYGESTTLRHRLHRLRAEMRKEQHADLLAAERCVVRRQLSAGKSAHDRNEANWEIVVEPADSRFLQVLAKAGVKIEEGDTPPLPKAPPASPVRTSTATEDAVKRFLNQEEK